MTLIEALMLLWWANESGDLNEAYWLIAGQYLVEVRHALGTYNLCAWCDSRTRRTRRADIEFAMHRVDRRRAR